jgi:hypothetical protein
MSGDKKMNGDVPGQNGINSTEDSKASADKTKASKGGKGIKDKDGDEEMTVVVPPSKSSGEPNGVSKDVEGDTVMNGASNVHNEETPQPVIDPKDKAIAGELYPHENQMRYSDTFLDRHQKQFHTTRASCQSV